MARSNPVYRSPHGRIAAVCMVLLAAALTACEGGGPVPSEPLESARQDTALEHAVKHANPKYVCPMHPQIVRDEPGSCPICGMTLVERQVEAQASERPVLTLDSALVQNLGVRTTRVARGDLSRRSAGGRGSAGSPRGSARSSCPSSTRAT